MNEPSGNENNDKSQELTQEQKRKIFEQRVRERQRQLDNKEITWDEIKGNNQQQVNNPVEQNEIEGQDNEVNHVEGQNQDQVLAQNLANHNPTPGNNDSIENNDQPAEVINKQPVQEEEMVVGNQNDMRQRFEAARKKQAERAMHPWEKQKARWQAKQKQLQEMPLDELKQQVETQLSNWGEYAGKSIKSKTYVKSGKDKAINVAKSMIDGKMELDDQKQPKENSDYKRFFANKGTIDQVLLDMGDSQYLAESIDPLVESLGSKKAATSMNYVHTKSVYQRGIGAHVPMRESRIKTGKDTTLIQNDMIEPNRYETDKFRDDIFLPYAEYMKRISPEQRAKFIQQMNHKVAHAMLQNSQRHTSQQDRQALNNAMKAQYDQQEVWKKQQKQPNKKFQMEIN